MRIYSFIILFFVLASCQQRSQYFDSISANDIALNKPQPVEWLYEHKEGGQAFNQYKNAKPVKPTSTKNIICLRPIGNFSPLQKNQIELIRAYLEIYFQLKTIVLPAMKVFQTQIDEFEKIVGSNCTLHTF